jgi:uncharacterized protein YndB with AHSA1/START domain
VSDPLVVEFKVNAAPAHAFDMWTRRCSMWWPACHTISGDPAAIRFEPRPGGRIVEQGADGSEHAWGEVLEWDPPLRVRYLWHLFFDRSEATEVEITFRTAGEGATAVRLEQSGWERLGAAGMGRKDGTRDAWGSITVVFAQACANT